jgi:hypothetical protein
MTCRMCEAYKKKLFQSDKRSMKQQATIRKLRAEIADLRASAPRAPAPAPEKQEVSKTDGLDFFEQYTGLQLKRMKFK